MARPQGPEGDELSSPLGGEAHLSAWAEGPPAKEENLAAESLQSGSRRNCSYPLFVYFYLFGCPGFLVVACSLWDLIF